MPLFDTAIFDGNIYDTGNPDSDSSTVTGSARSKTTNYTYITVKAEIELPKREIAGTVKAKIEFDWQAKAYADITREIITKASVAAKNRRLTEQEFQAKGKHELSTTRRYGLATAENSQAYTSIVNLKAQNTQPVTTQIQTRTKPLGTLEALMLIKTLEDN